MTCVRTTPGEVLGTVPGTPPARRRVAGLAPMSPASRLPVGTLPDLPRRAPGHPGTT